MSDTETLLTQIEEALRNTLLSKYVPGRADLERSFVSIRKLRDQIKLTEELAEAAVNYCDTQSPTEETAEVEYARLVSAVAAYLWVAA